MTASAQTVPASPSTDRLTVTEGASLQPVRAIRALLGISTAVIALGVISALGLAYSAYMASVVVSPGCVSTGSPACDEWGITPATVTYAAMALASVVSAVWFGAMARGLAAVIRLLAETNLTEKAT